MKFFNTPDKPATADTLTAAQRSVEDLTAALALARKESAAATQTFDRDLRRHIAGDLKDAPSQEAQHAANARVASLGRSLVEVQDYIVVLTADAESNLRLQCIRECGSRVSDLTIAAESKLTEFEQAAALVRKAEKDLFEALFNENTGLRQPFGVGETQRDAHFARHRLRHQAIKIAKESGCLINARFETDGEVHLGPKEYPFRNQ